MYHFNLSNFTTSYLKYPINKNNTYITFHSYFIPFSFGCPRFTRPSLRKAHSVIFGAKVILTPSFIHFIKAILPSLRFGRGFNFVHSSRSSSPPPIERDKPMDFIPLHLILSPHLTLFDFGQSIKFRFISLSHYPYLSLNSSAAGNQSVRQNRM